MASTADAQHRAVKNERAAETVVETVTTTYPQLARDTDCRDKYAAVNSIPYQITAGKVTGSQHGR